MHHGHLLLSVVGIKEGNFSATACPLTEASTQDPERQYIRLEFS